MSRLRASLLLCLVLAVPAKAVAQQPAGSSPASSPAQPTTQKPDQTPPPSDQPTEPQKYEDQVVVTASRVEQKLVNAPATVSLISAQTIASSPSASYAELLRAVPGLNVTQTSARDINLVSRSASGTLSTSQLALIDGRSIYQDFFGFVAWDFLPVNPSEIKQIEVIRGPASAVWGANALTGVVNVITKSPRELVGQSLLVSVGTFGRDASGVERSNGSLFSISGSHAAAPSERLAYKITAGFSTQDALGRPSGLIPNSTNTPYPAYENSGTSQPKFDVRVDLDSPDTGRKLVFAGGFAGTEGMIHTGIGPFDIDRGTFLAYGKVNYSKGGMRLNAFVNHLDGEATNRLSRDAAGTFIPFSFKNTTFDVEASDVRTWRNRHVVSFGGNVRYNSFDLSLAPRGDSRTEAGVYGQDEIFLSEHFRAVVGARVDKFSSISGGVFSPRLTFMYKPSPSQTVRTSFNRAYRAPSHVNNYLDVTLANVLDLGALNPQLAGRQFVFPVRAIGNEDLKEEKMTAYEIGYTGIISQPRHRQRGVLRQRHRQLDLLHAEWVVPRHQPAARLADIAARPRADPAVRTLRSGQRPAVDVHLPESRIGAAEGRRARRRGAGHRHAHRLRQLLVSARTGTRGLRHHRAESAVAAPLQHRRRLQQRQVARQRRRQLRELGVLAGRARLAVPRPDRALHDHVGDGRLQVARRSPGDVAQDQQPVRRGDPAARLRRRDAPPDRRRAAGRVLARPEPLPRRRHDLRTAGISVSGLRCRWPNSAGSCRSSWR